ncbi:MAG: glycosyltransferase family 4 protein [Hyphomicrobiales bacterium]|nr:glycosyltransferase family 4 protein [Hyphomicrobiales bacterium]
MRAPVGGLFRHVVDLVRGQAARGHRVGLVADASTGGERAEAALTALAPALALGLTRIAMSRQLGYQDVAACAHVTERAARCNVVHGHGAKGGAYARLARAPHAIRVYTPHGGSLHYDWRTPAGFLYLAAERLLMRRTDLFLFESAYGRDVFRRKVGEPGARARVVHNGVAEGELAPVATLPDATDLVFVGELRRLKGVDVLIAAVAQLAAAGQRVSLTVVGDGPDRAQFEAAAQGHAIRFAGALPARAAFARGRILVVPSRAESLPYIVLEAAAAAMPLIATRVGGIPEIYGPDADQLIQPDDPAALAQAIRAALAHPPSGLAARLQARVRAEFSVAAMTEQVLAAYRTAQAQQG